MVFGAVLDADAEVEGAQARMGHRHPGRHRQGPLEIALGIGWPAEFGIGVGQVELGRGILAADHGGQLQRGQHRIGGLDRVDGGDADHLGRLQAGLADQGEFGRPQRFGRASGRQQLLGLDRALGGRGDSRFGCKSGQQLGHLDARPRAEAQTLGEEGLRGVYAVCRVTPPA